MNVDVQRPLVIAIIIPGTEEISSRDHNTKYTVYTFSCMRVLSPM